MNKNKPYEIIENVDGTLTLRVGTVCKTFRNAITLQSFARELYERLSARRTGIFRLQDGEDGRLKIKFNKGGEVISVKNYDQAELFASMIMQETDSKLVSINGNR